MKKRWKLYFLKIVENDQRDIFYLSILPQHNMRCGPRFEVVKGGRTGARGTMWDRLWTPSFVVFFPLPRLPSCRVEIFEIEDSSFFEKNEKHLRHRKNEIAWNVQKWDKNLRFFGVDISGTSRQSGNIFWRTKKTINVMTLQYNYTNALA